MAMPHRAKVLFQLRDFAAGGAVLRNLVEETDEIFEEVRTRRGARRIVDLSIMWDEQMKSEKEGKGRNLRCREE